MLARNTIGSNRTISRWRLLLIGGILPVVSPAYGQQIPNIPNIDYKLASSAADSTVRAMSNAKPFRSFVDDAPRTDGTAGAVNLTSPAGADDRSALGAQPAAKLGPPAPSAGDALSDADAPGGGNHRGFSDDYEVRERRLRKTNGSLEFVFQALNLADLAETLSCLHRHTCQEANPIIGKHPSDAKLIGLKSLTGLAHFIIYEQYKNRDARFIFDFECISVGIESVVVGLNLRHTF